MAKIRISRLLAPLVLLLVLCASVRGQAPAAPALTSVITIDHGPNSPAQQAKPYVVLVALDGFRYDYAQKYGAKNLLALANAGASAPQGMIPSYPSVTFPNLYTLVTGLYPEHHGIVANSFYDPQSRRRFTMTDRNSSNDGSWYGGVPLWVLAEKQGMRSACFFWLGSEAEIAGMRPSYYLRFQDDFPDEKRVDQVMAWLRLPPARRPHFITLYYSNVDHTGHDYGPDSPQTAAAVRHLDDMVGRLQSALKTLPLRVNLIVVSDHGMENVQGIWIDLDRYADLSEFTTVGSMLYPRTESAAARAFAQLRRSGDRLRVYRRSQVPLVLHYGGNPRTGDPVVVPAGPYLVRARPPANPAGDAMPPKGMHGYDPRQVNNMNAIFYAAGPDIVPGTKLPPFENIHVYPLIARILGLSTGPIDGKIEVLQRSLKTPPAAPRVP